MDMIMRHVAGTEMESEIKKHFEDMFGRAVKKVKKT